MRMRWVMGWMGAVVVLTAGCMSSQGALVREKAEFQSLKPGESRLGVCARVGAPTDRADGFYHYEEGPARDAWLYFDPNGRLSQVEWQDEESLRLGWTTEYLGQ